MIGLSKGVVLTSENKCKMKEKWRIKKAVRSAPTKN